MLQFQNARREGVSRHAAQEADFAAVGLGGEVIEENEAGGKGPIVHGFLEELQGWCTRLGITWPMLLSFKPSRMLDIGRANRVAGSQMISGSRFEHLHVTCLDMD